MLGGTLLSFTSAPALVSAAVVAFLASSVTILAYAMQWHRRGRCSSCSRAGVMGAYVTARVIRGIQRLVGTFIGVAAGTLVAVVSVVSAVLRRRQAD